MRGAACGGEYAAKGVVPNRGASNFYFDGTAILSGKYDRLSRGFAPPSSRHLFVSI
jgi:hypothetical protein